MAQPAQVLVGEPLEILRVWRSARRSPAAVTAPIAVSQPVAKARCKALTSGRADERTSGRAPTALASAGRLSTRPVAVSPAKPAASTQCSARSVVPKRATGRAVLAAQRLPVHLEREHRVRSPVEMGERERVDVGPLGRGEGQSPRAGTAPGTLEEVAEPDPAPADAGHRPPGHAVEVCGLACARQLQQVGVGEGRRPLDQAADAQAPGRPVDRGYGGSTA
ncbi:MAG TPA: hypothetical protein VF533_08315 [Solirubrobacteraceae bacterium]